MKRTILTFLQALLSMLALLLGGIATVVLRPDYGPSLSANLGRLLRLLLVFVLSIAGLVNLFRLYWPIQVSIWKERGKWASIKGPTGAEYAYCGATGIVSVLGVCLEKNWILSSAFLLLALCTAGKAAYLWFLKREMEQDTKAAPPGQK